VSEVGSTPELAFKTILEQLNKLSAGQNKTYAFQDQLAPGQDKLAAYHEELKQNVCLKELKSEISDIKAAQMEFREKITDTLHRQLKGVVGVVRQQVKIFVRSSVVSSRTRGATYSASIRV
jgi:hypothetical protein